MRYTEYQNYTPGNMFRVIYIAGALLSTLILTVMVIIKDYPLTGVLLGVVPILVSHAVVTRLKHIRLSVFINDQSITAFFAPFMKNPFRINWRDIEHAEIVNYNPDGFGLHHNPRYGMIINASAHTGLLMTNKYGLKYFIGITHPEIVKHILRQLKEAKVLAA